MHIPFCTHRCDYCAFATWTDRFHLTDRYVDAVVADIAQNVAAGQRRASSIFFGGGTPSLLASEQLARILAAVPREDSSEVTVECNPDTVDVAKLTGYRAAGVNRLSFGVQSMVPHVLTALGRTHDPANVHAAVAAARTAGIDNVNVDLIYGAVGESLDDWRHTLEGALALEPDHVSAYGLTLEPGTPLAADPSRHPDDDEQADKYLLAASMLEDGGLSWYEISNFARPGRASRHNVLYWTEGDYHGFGCAAHSHVAGRRWWNVRTPERYIDAVERGASVVAGTEELDAAQRAAEALQLAVRLRSGVPASALHLGDGPFDVPPELVELVDDDRADDAEPRARLTVQGRLLANEVTVRLRVPVPSRPSESAPRGR